MYSVVLMTALTAGSAAPDWHFTGYGCCYHGHHGGCPGCSSGGYEGCGCWGGYSNWSYCPMPPPNMPVPSYSMPSGTVAPSSGPGIDGEELDKPKPKKNGEKQTTGPKNAKLLVELPTKAKLFIDDRPVQAAAGVQIFDTPALEPGQDYFYLVRIEMMQDGQPVSETRRILVRAGQVARADFHDWEPKSVKTAQAK